ncbi:MAG: CDP-diacylglycerol--glycerol-3-phosphate 3-phosphatidyltransferase [Thermodesulfobacteriota bacterium]|nr:CDP-diacylglycerol--glycerol-3-phosphate 3-phosphatidyltransferase [Thermodesulfobacteriota bacterium]
MNTIPSIKKVLQDPNMLTLSRIAASPVIVILLLLPMNRFTMFLAALVFSAAAITDYFDGFFARKYGQVSNFGKAMDPLADKFLMSATFIMLTARGLIPGWMVCLIVARELGITGMRTLLVEKGADIGASIWGKLKTVFQIAALIPLLLHYSYFGIDCHAVGSWLLWIAVVLTVVSAVNYFLEASRFLEN